MMMMNVIMNAPAEQCLTTAHAEHFLSPSPTVPHPLSHSHALASRGGSAASRKIWSINILQYGSFVFLPAL